MADAAVALEVSPFFTHGSRAAQERDAERRRLLAAQRWLTVEATDPDLVSAADASIAASAALRELVAPITSCALRGAGHPTAHTTSRWPNAG